LAQLLEKASLGPKAGLRNPALKLLRVHLAPLRPELENLQGTPLTPAAAELRSQLALAAALHPIAPKPGRVDWQIVVPANGNWQFGSEALRTYATRLQGSDPLRRFLQVRRHLGWEVGLALLPAEESAVRTVAAAASELSELGNDLAEPPRALVWLPGAEIPKAIHFPKQPVSGASILRIRKQGESLQMEWTASDSEEGGRRNASTKAVQIESFSSGSAREDLQKLVDAWPAAFREVVLIVSPDLVWSELTRCIQPALRQCHSAELLVEENETNSQRQKSSGPAMFSPSIR
jgi:hypothetical protein